MSHIYLCARVCLCVFMYTGALGGQNRGMEPLELELQGGVRCRIWVLGTGPRPLEDQKAFLTTQPSSLAPIFIILKLETCSLLCSFNFCVCACVFMCTTCGDKQRASDPLDPQLQTAANSHVGAGNRTRASTRASALNFWVISPSVKTDFCGSG